MSPRQSQHAVLAFLGFAVACGSLNSGQVIVEGTSAGSSGGSAGEHGSTDTADAGGAMTSAGGAGGTNSSSGGSAGDNDASSSGAGPTNDATATTKSSDDASSTSTTGSECPGGCSGEQTCQAGTCECPEDEPDWCSEECTDVLADAKHCGACGHSCHGGPCKDGRCEPITLAEGRTAPWALAVNDEGVYWLEEDAVLATALDGGAVVTLAAENEVAKPVSIAASPATVYYTNTGEDVDCTCYQRTIMEVPATGGGSPTNFGKADPTFSSPWGVAYSDGIVYWHDRYWVGIYALDEDMGGSEADEIFFGGNNYAQGYEIAVDESYVYWGDVSNGVLKHPLSDGNVVWLKEWYDPNQAIYHLAVGGGYVYWTLGTPTTPLTTTPLNNEMWRVPIEGGTAVPILSSIVMTPAVAADAKGVYWSDGDINRTPHDGGPTELIAKGENAGFIALDDDFVYWTDATGGKVMKVAK